MSEWESQSVYLTAPNFVQPTTLKLHRWVIADDYRKLYALCHRNTRAGGWAFMVVGADKHRLDAMALTLNSGSPRWRYGGVVRYSDPNAYFVMELDIRKSM